MILHMKTFMVLGNSVLSMMPLPHLLSAGVPAVRRWDAAGRALSQCHTLFEPLELSPEHSLLGSSCLSQMLR